MKNKVLYIIGGLKNGGTERQLIEITKLFPRNNFYLILISFGSNEHYEDEAKKIFDQYLHINKEGNKIRLAITLLKIIKKINPDIIHSWDSFSSFYTFIVSKIIKTKFIDGSIRDAGIEKGFRYYLKCFVLKRANVIIANSNAGLKYYKVKGLVIYNAINQDRFYANKFINDFNIIKVANFSDYKDHNTFIKAAIILATRNVVDKIYLAGDGKNRAYIEEIVKKQEEKISSKFFFLGSINNVEKYLNKCQIGVLCSTVRYGEGLSNSLLEYMAAGLIPIATNIGGSNEIIKNNENGFLFKSKNHNELINLIVKIKEDSDLKNRIKKNGKEMIINKFNYEKNIKKFIDIYENI